MPLARAAACLLILACAGCGASNNKATIEGKWRLAPGEAADTPRFRDAVVRFDGEGNAQLASPDLPRPFGWRYKLLAGDAADFYALPPEGSALFAGTADRARVSIRITLAPDERREMTLTDPAGRTHRLTRIPGPIVAFATPADLPPRRLP